MADVYIENIHNAPITCNAREGAKVLFTIKFMPLVTDKWSGRDISSGYTNLTGEQYKQLEESSRTFKHYKDDLKLLIVHDELPEALKTPHQVLSEAKALIREYEAKIKQLEAENDRLKGEAEKVGKKPKKDSEAVESAGE